MKNRKRILVTAILTMALYGLFIGCQESQAPGKASKETGPTPGANAQNIVLEGDDEVLARVNGSAITRYDLELTIATTLGEQSARRLDDRGRRKVLESLVAARAITRVQAADLSAAEQAVLDKKAAAYREQLLVKQYLAQHAAPQPVTQEMVRAYYQDHPERFGARTIRTYEILAGSRKLNPAQRDALLAELKGAGHRDDWQQWAQALQGRGYPIAWRQGRGDEKLLQPQLRQLMTPLEKGQASPVSFVQGLITIVRIVDEAHMAPRPLPEVSAEIRKILLPVQLKKAVKQASEQALATTEVVYEEK